MAETTHDLRSLPRDNAYVLLDDQLRHVLAGIDDRIAAMATVAALVHHGFGHLWTGFYVVADPGRLLRVGPYQGTLGCMEIPFGQGVCGAAAARRETVIVPDVQAFNGHIVCDPRSRSEIVVPVFARGGALMAVLDVDSAETAAFDQRDAIGLERIVSLFARAAGDERAAD
jgi:L-methionine (R)-S-oxide reductase